MPVEINRISYWIESGDSELLTHAHLPVTDRPISTAVLICGPVGFEAIHAHRSLAFLADELARHQVVALRFDYCGTGNSSGDATMPDLVNQWQENIATLVSHIRQDWELDQVR